MTIDFWAMGREGEVVQELTREFERAESRHPGPGAADPLERGAREAADRLRRRCHAGRLPARQHLGSGVRGARCDHPARRPDRGLARARARGFLRRHRRDRTRSEAVSTACRGTSTHGSCSIGRTSWRAPAIRRRRAAGSEWRDAMARIKRLVGPEPMPSCCPGNEWAPVVILALAAGCGAVEGRCRVRQFPRPGLSQGARLLSLDCSGTGSPRPRPAPRSPICIRSSRTVASHVHHRPLEPRRVRRALPAALQDAWWTAPMPAPDGDWPGVSLAGGASLAIHRGSAHKEAAWKLIEFLAAHGAADPLLPAERQPAGADRGLAGPGAGRRSARARLLRAAAAGPSRPRRSPSGSRSRPRIARRVEQAGARREPAPRRRSRRSMPTSIRSSRSAAGCSTVARPERPRRRRSRARAGAGRGMVSAGFWFALPGARADRGVLRPPGRGRPRAQPHRFRHLCARPSRVPALRRARATTAGCSRTRCSGGRCSTPSISCWWADRSRFSSRSARRS